MKNYISNHTLSSHAPALSLMDNTGHPDKSTIILNHNLKEKKVLFFQTIKPLKSNSESDVKRFCTEGIAKFINNPQSDIL